MNLKEIKEIIDLITEKGISEFELERDGIRVKISRHVESQRAPAAHPAASATHPVEKAAAAPEPVSGTPVPALSNVEPMPAPLAEDLHVVRSPMVGTFYASPDHGTAPFVQVGDKVQPGQILCIIEAMKLMNEIEAEIAGEVIKCHVENGQPVEYGESLFDLRPAVPAKKRS